MQSFERTIESTLQSAEELRIHEQYAEAVRLLESQPPSIAQTQAVQKALETARDASVCEADALQAVGSAYAYLEYGDGGKRTLQENAKSPLLSRIVPIFASRRKSVADRQMSSAIDRASAAFDAGDKKQAAKALDSVAAFAEFASKDLQNEWNTLSKKAGRARR
jgi:hypothetical protein